MHPHLTEPGAAARRDDLLRTALAAHRVNLITPGAARDRRSTATDRLGVAFTRQTRTRGTTPACCSA